ncbi:hypothetical protein GQ53DRAFT_755673 [Thozetella sp. PMI_491]|nr:hypothetical protein GQ53DRAFT_755673 [Thozetella sp. PMI_491]
MTQDSEKPLLSDYEVHYNEKEDALTPVRDEQPSETLLRATPANQCEHNRKFQKFQQFTLKIATPVSRKAVGLGCESFVPLPIDEECQKAARIIKSFSYAPRESTPPSHSEAAPHIVTIPPCVIASAVGLLVFTTGRVGFGHLSGSTGSGLLVVRQESGEWGTPVPVQAYSLGGGPLAFGAEVTDRVYVLNNRSALDLFRSARFELGPEVVLAAGPYGGGGGITFSGMPAEGKQDAGQAAQSTAPARCSCGKQHEGAFQGLRRSLAQPVYCYMRSRGLYAGLQAEGTVFVQHPDQSVPESSSAVFIDALKEAESISH